MASGLNLLDGGPCTRCVRLVQEDDTNTRQGAAGLGPVFLSKGLPLLAGTGPFAFGQL